MEHYRSRFYRNSASHRVVLFPVLLWLSGIVLGILLAFILRDNSVMIIAAAVQHRVSIFGLCFVLVLPCIVSIVAYKSSAFWPSCILTLARGICFGHAIPATLWAFGTAAWLLHFLLSFSNLMIQVPFFVIEFDYLSTNRYMQYKKVLLLLFFATIIGLFDYFIVSPGVLTL